MTRTWNAAYEASPQARTSPGLGDDQIRNLKLDVRERMDREHQFDPATDETGKQGIHKAGSAMPFVQDTEPLARPDATAFVADYDEGRLWIDTSKGGKLFYLAEVTDTPSAGTPVWKPALNETVGKIVHFASTPADEDRWLLCDGRLITDSEPAGDGTDGGYAELITVLHEEAGGVTDHPYYASAAGTSAYIPDLRGSVIRGIEDEQNTSDKRGRGTNLYDADGKRDSGGFQDAAVMDHDHQMDHTHGAAISAGYDNGDGLTGVDDSWSTGTPTLSDDGEHNHTVPTEGDVDVASFGSTVRGYIVGSGSNRTFPSAGSEHNHAITRFWGLTRKLSVQTEDVTHGVPKRDYATLDGDNTMSNVALYAYIKY